MDLGLSQKVVLISGSSRGLGRAIAVSFLDEGSRVVVTGRRRGDLHRAVRDLSRRAGPENVSSFAGDLTRRGTIQRCLKQVQKRYKRLDVLVVNLGTGRGELGWQAGDADWARLLEANLSGPMRLVRAAIPKMTGPGERSIVLISSIAGLETVGGPHAYGAAKAGLTHAAKQLAGDLAQRNIRVNVVAPGNILTPGGRWDKKLKKERKKVMAYIEKTVPLRRFAKPEEIAGVVTFVASPRAGFMTGACVVVDGGQTRRF